MWGSLDDRSEYHRSASIVSEIQKSYFVGNNTSGLEQSGEKKASIQYIADLSNIIIIDDDIDFYNLFEIFFEERKDCKYSRVINNKNSDGSTVVDFMNKLHLVEIVAEDGELREWLKNRCDVKSHSRG